MFVIKVKNGPGFTMYQRFVPVYVFSEGKYETRILSKAFQYGSFYNAYLDANRIKEADRKIKAISIVEYLHVIGKKRIVSKWEWNK